MKIPAQILAEARAAERDTCELLRKAGFYDDHNQPRVAADAQTAEQAETRRRRAEARRDQRERQRTDIDARLAAIEQRLAVLESSVAVLDAERAAVVDFVTGLTGDVVAALREEFSPMQKRLAELQTELRALSAEREQTLDLPPLRSLRSRRDAN